MNTDVFIIETGTANLASVRSGLRRVGATPRTATSPQTILESSHVVLPGVGSFAAALRQITHKGLAQAVAARVVEGRPTLAICLGMQLLCESSAESPADSGLGVLPGALAQFSSGVRVPHLGWNHVEPSPASNYLREGFAYFAHSYRLSKAPPGWIAASTEYGGVFVSAIERAGILACQFHPELSADWGTAVLRRWLDLSAHVCETQC